MRAQFHRYREGPADIRQPVHKAVRGFPKEKVKGSEVPASPLLVAPDGLPVKYLMGRFGQNYILLHTWPQKRASRGCIARTSNKGKCHDGNDGA